MLIGALPAPAAAVLLGLGTALCAGVGTFTGQRLTGRVGWLRATFAAHVAAWPLVTAVALLHGGVPAWQPALAHALGLGLLNALSVVALFRAFAGGSLAIVGPIASSYAAVTLALAFLTGDPPAPRLVIGLLVVIVGVATVAAVRGRASDDGKRTRAAGVAWAVLASMSLGAVFFWLAPVSAALGPVWPVALMRVSGVLALGLLRVALTPEKPSARLPRAILAASVLLDTGGLVLDALGAGLGGAALVAVLASLSAVITVGLAHWRLHERLSPGQWIGVSLVLAGTAWISYYAHLE